MTWLQDVDLILFHWINSTLSNSAFDLFLPFCREKWFWAPLYVFIVASVLTRFRSPKSAILLLGLLFSVGLSDFTSSQLVKKNVQRLRPCNDPQVENTMTLRVECGSGYSFTSSHAANHFGVAAFCYVAFTGLFSLLFRRSLFLWAGLIAFAQVYVGVHYPGDVIAGAILGMTCGYVVGVLCARWGRGLK